MGTHSISALFATALVVLSVKMTLLIKSQKLNYYLISEACTVIQDLSLTLDNYKGVVDLLKERFADAQVLISANMDALLSLKIGSSCHDILHLRNIYDAGHVQARNFVPFDIYGFLWPNVGICTPKQTFEDIKIKISRHMPDGK